MKNTNAQWAPNDWYLKSNENLLKLKIIRNWVCN